MTDTIESLRAERDMYKTAQESTFKNLMSACDDRDAAENMCEHLKIERDAMRAERDAIAHKNELLTHDRDGWRNAANHSLEQLKKMAASKHAERTGRLLRACQSLHKWWKQEYANRCGEYGRFVAAAKERDTLRSRVAELEKALRPFAEFEFGPRWFGYELMQRGQENPGVLCGHDADGNETTKIMFSDFKRARALLSAPAPAPTADKKCECAHPRSATGTLCWDCGRPMRDAPAPAKEET